MARVMEKPVVTRKTTTKTRTVKRSTKTTGKALSTEERNQMIAETAYFIAEESGFQPGNETQYWLEAEKRINEKHC